MSQTVSNSPIFLVRSDLRLLAREWSLSDPSLAHARSVYLALCEGDDDPERAALDSADFERAVEELARIGLLLICDSHGPTLIDPDDAEPPCPHCESEHLEELREQRRVDTPARMRAVFHLWASLNGGLAPRRSDWICHDETLRRWPSVGAVETAVEGFAEYEPYMQDPAPHQEAGREIANRNYVTGENEPYCVDCVHGSGCRPRRLMSQWRFAVEEIAGLRVRRGADASATPGQRLRHGRNRQMVTGGRSDVRVEVSDPSAASIIETIDPR